MCSYCHKNINCLNFVLNMDNSRNTELITCIIVRIMLDFHSTSAPYSMSSRKMKTMSGKDLDQCFSECENLFCKLL